jgi:lipopolysaccharide/colanic/teichoic acid biosynthesis glycosyltransferase
LLVKRTVDIALSAAALVLFLPLLVTIAALIKIDSPGEVLFRQQRVGRGFRPFFIYKFRTMVKDAPALGRSITVGDDPRITRAGRLLRRFKLDELPQLINVLKGDMSIVGPRPELPQYVNLLRQDYRQILRVRPGLTDMASLKFIDEAALLAGASDPENTYRERILPAKTALAKQYVDEQCFGLDLRIVIQTVCKLARQ